MAYSFWRPGEACTHVIYLHEGSKNDFGLCCGTWTATAAITNYCKPSNNGNVTPKRAPHDPHVSLLNL